MSCKALPDLKSELRTSRFKKHSNRKKMEGEKEAVSAVSIYMRELRLPKSIAEWIPKKVANKRASVSLSSVMGD